MPTNTKTYGSIDKCQSCKSKNIEKIFYLGYLPPVNTMRKIGDLAQADEWFPTELYECNECKLIQLGYIVPPEILFPPSYPYTSGTTKSLVDNFHDLAKEARGFISINKEDLVLDIGSNDGSLLDAFRTHIKCNVVGIEPTNAANIAIKKNITTYNKFFDQNVVKDVIKEHGLAKVITATNVFAHIHEVNFVMDAIDDLMCDEGVFISESHYLASIILGLQYDTIYHEHLRYYSLHSIKHLLESRGFKIIKAKKINTHGGSIRVYATKNQSYKVDSSIAEILTEEMQLGLVDNSAHKQFAKNVTKAKFELLKLLSSINDYSENIVAIGAPSRASTLVNYVGLDQSTINCIYEIRGSSKIGYYLPGTDIPIFDEEELYQKQPKYALLLSWHIAEHLCVLIKKRGFKGDFIIPLPTPKIIKNEDVLG